MIKNTHMLLYIFVFFSGSFFSVESIFLKYQILKIRMNVERCLTSITNIKLVNCNAELYRSLTVLQGLSQKFNSTTGSFKDD